MRVYIINGCFTGKKLDDRSYRDYLWVYIQIIQGLFSNESQTKLFISMDVIMLGLMNISAMCRNSHNNLEPNIDYILGLTY